MERCSWEYTVRDTVNVLGSRSRVQEAWIRASPSRKMAHRYKAFSKKFAKDEFSRIVHVLFLPHFVLNTRRLGGKKFFRLTHEFSRSCFSGHSCSLHLLEQKPFGTFNKQNIQKSLKTIKSIDVHFFFVLLLISVEDCRRRNFRFSPPVPSQSPRSNLSLISC